MSRVPGWLGRLGAGLTEMSGRLEQRRQEARRSAADDGRSASSDQGPPTPEEAALEYAATHHAVVVRDRPDPAQAVPWGVRVAAEAGWRLLVLAGTVWVLMRVISAVQLVVLAFVAALLITALLQPTVAWLRRHGVPRGPATALTAILGFVVMGLIGWFVTWQVMENIDNLSDQVQDGIDELRNWLLNSPFHVTDKQINEIAKNLREAVGANTDQITSAGLEGVTVVVEALTGILLAAFSTLFLLYDGKRIWQWTLKLVPAAARPGVAGAGPRAWRTLTAYVRGTVIVALIDAIFIGLGIYFLDVPMAVPLAVFIFLFAFIPLVGAVVSGALAVVVALVTQGVFAAVMTLVVVLAVQQIEGHILQPFILGRAVRVHPLAVVLSVAAGGMIAGIGGAVVAVPLVAVTNTVVGYLRAYSREAAARQTPEPRGATAVGASPATDPPPGPPQPPSAEPPSDASPA
ncbi:AI-2E family transporter [Streptomyces parvulus]|uniref:AI-2E family transporter n=1 Tax=Streptomyces parvulus TaxID=146923 RepID=A0A191V2Z7_9ACTN|nr:MULTISPECIES: AI-2E family transporter [Streptomyces]ANJ09278.1 AI-2E family transporter [Streptomyces parvulus]MCC9156808.1 AI-2E family transporter [Streptomyces parvulus]MCE7690110.1 AI-2E family transporter [Streptomyces parvulus]MZD56179.1 AI-2E family transporter [Streptomyces sp. SID5606]WHM31035.1 AI-2E family transporter [Streptomyces sp. BPPL-273]